MSRSYRKTPIGSSCNSESEKKDKQLWHRRFRRKCKAKLDREGEDLELLPDYREVSNPWWMAKDGKGWFGQYKYGPKDGCIKWHGEHKLYHAICVDCPCKSSKLNHDVYWIVRMHQYYIELMRK